MSKATSGTDQGAELQDVRGGRFWMDDDIIDQHAAKIGPYALAVYTYLCRRANKQKQAMPSLKRMGDELGMSRSTVQKAIDTLAAHRLVGVSQRKQGDTQEYTSNLYTILDASRGIGVPSKNIPIPPDNTPYTATQHTVYRETVTKEDTIKEDTIKDIAADAAAPKLGPWPYTPEQDRHMTEGKERADQECYLSAKQEAFRPSKKKPTGKPARSTPQELDVPPPAPPVAPEQAAAALDIFNSLESASGRELPPPTGTSKDAIERALEMAANPSRDPAISRALKGEIRRAGKEIRDDDVCTADDIMTRCVGKGSLFYTTYLAEDSDGGLTNPPTPMTIRKWIWSFETMRSKRCKVVRQPVDFEQQLVEAEARAARSRELHDTPSPFPTLIPAWQVLSQPRKTA